MPMTFRGRPYLGSFTWAALQAAYPNGGAALAALPADAQAFVTDWSVAFVPSNSKSYWSVSTPTSIVLDTTLQTGSTSGSNQIVKQSLVPAGILRACRKFIVYMGVGKTNTTDPGTSGSLRIGAAGTLSDASFSQFIALTTGSRSQATVQEYVVGSATALIQVGPANKSGWSGTGTSDVYLTSRAVDDIDANALWFSLTVAIGGTSSAPTAYHLEVALVP